MFSYAAIVGPTLLVALLGGGVGLVVYLVLTQAEEKASLRASLRQLDDYDSIENVREQDLLAPLQERLMGPVAQKLSKLGSRLNPPEYVDSVRRKHLQAGISDPDQIERFLAFRIIGFLFIPVWIIFMLTVNPLGLSGWKMWAMLGLGAMVGALGPASRLDNKVESRHKEIQRTLPDVMDLLVISVEAGLGFEQALDRVIVNVPGALSDEFARVLGETRAGSTRAEAMRAMDERCDSPEVRSFVLALIQADTFGVSIGRVLRSQADEMRVKRRQRAQEQAQKAPVKMLIPMVFCIFPALFVVVLGPALINISENL